MHEWNRISTYKSDGIWEPCVGDPPLEATSERVPATGWPGDFPRFEEQELLHLRKGLNAQSSPIRLLSLNNKYTKHVL